MIVTVDTETTGLSPRTDQLVLVGFAIDNSDPIALRHPDDGDLIRDFLTLPATFVGHNCHFDRHFLAHNGYVFPPPARWVDTQILAHVAGTGGERKAGNTTLDRLTKRLIDLGELPADALEPEAAIKQWLKDARRRAKREGRPRPEKGHAPFTIAAPYLAADVACTRAVHAHYAGSLNGQAAVLELEQRVAPALFAAEARGVPIDMPAAQTVRRDSAAKLAALRARLFELAGRPFSLDSSQQLEAVLQDRGVDLGEALRTPTGLMARSADALERIDDELVSTLLEHRLERIFLGLFDNLLKRTVNGRLYGTFKQVGAETGRMSSGDPNLMNIPSHDLRARYCVRAGPGNMLVAADLSAVELRVLAAYAPGGALQRDLAEGLDPHQRIADELGVDRDIGKRFNFGVLYGAGVSRVATILGVDRHVAKRALDRWYATYPEIARLKVGLSRAIRRRGYIVTAGGRRHYAETANHMTLNYLVQGSAADLFKSAVAELHAAGVPMILFVHDEIACEVPADAAAETARLLETAMARGNHRVGGLVAESAVHERWSDFKQPGYTPSDAKINQDRWRAA